jgi:PBP superfamily domain
MLRQVALLVCLISLAGSSPHAAGQQASITVASTTSTEQSGLFGYILPRFTSKTGIGVHVVALGTGQALDVGRRGDADVVFVHDQAAEEEFVAQGFGVKRYAVMYNDFVLIGPQTDPAKIAGGKDILEALRKIGAAKVPFISRGDRSGTHAAELRYWKEASVDLAAVKGPWYREIGQGMGAALRPQIFGSCSVTTRATMSVGPPAANGTMKRTIRLGQSSDCVCAHAARPLRLSASADPADRAIRRRRVSTATSWPHLFYPSREHLRIAYRWMRSLNSKMT